VVRNLTIRQDEEWAEQIITYLEANGYPFDRYNVSLNAYLAASFGSITSQTVTANSHSPTDVIAGLASHYSGQSLNRGNVPFHEALGILNASLLGGGGGGGGSGAPDWVPANAKIYIDLVGNRAWTEADGTVAIDTLLGSDANTDNGWAATSYDPSHLTENGYLNGVVALIGGARTMAMDSATIRVALFTPSPQDIFVTTYIAFVSADGNDAVEVDVNAAPPNVHGSSWNGPASTIVDNIVNSGPDVTNVVAFTITGTRLDIAANGSEAVAGSLDSDDRPPGNALVAALIALGDGDYTALQSITIYDALPDTTGLSALSVTA
jgi:hypothetical protein